MAGGELIGSAEVELAGVAPLERAGPGDLSFLAAARYLPAFQRSRAGAVLVRPDDRSTPGGPSTRIVVSDPYRALSGILRALFPPPAPSWGVHPRSIIGAGSRWRGRIAIGAYTVLGRDVVLGQDCIVGPHVVIGDGVRIGDECRVGAHVTVESGSVLGGRVVLEPGARIGTRGFGYLHTATGHNALPQVGGCVLGDRVEIGANTTVDRGSLDDTTIGADTKVDNLVHVAHNVRIGARCLIMAQVGIAGSTQIEDDVTLAGQAGIADHLTIGRGATVAAQSGVIGDVPPRAIISGYPARRHREVLRQTAALRRLTTLVKPLEEIARRRQ